MFCELQRHRNMDGKVIISVYDNCFTAKVVDNCPCRAPNCPHTFYHLIKLYESKSLNISKNLAKYIDWLADIGKYPYDELREQEYILAAMYPELRYVTKYRYSVSRYIRSKKKK